FAKGGTPVRKTISIIKLLRDDVEFACRGSNVKCSLNIPDDLWPVDIDEGQINQVIYNIVINAGHAMSEGGTVELSAENINAYADNRYFVKEGKYVKIAISDTGSGISEENLNKIFDPYFTTKKTGSGLGLASAYSIIKNHDGYISVESKVGKGTTFYIYLPKSQSEAAVIKEHEEGLVYGEGKILVMDDEEILRTAAGMILGELGYSADFARDGKEAIKLYKKAKDSGEPFNAVLMDLTIPAGMGGKEAIKELIKIDPDIRAIVCSGYSNDPIMSEYKDYGFSAAIVKPYNIDELSRTINEVVKGKGSE
ncbi:MAG TPA: hybrid sensor histidine kinase/response regulator, partial [Nitrospinae bacterium]|nr:hybrid sensor histidine kinase/response regulator [Nitrospinota bacterium]